MSANTSKRNSQLVSCIIYPPGSWDNVVRIKITLSKCYVVHFRRYQQYYMRTFSSGYLYFPHYYIFHLTKLKKTLHHTDQQRFNYASETLKS